MKNEDRIVELLAENLSKLDQHSGLLGRIVDVLITFGNSFNKLTNTLGIMSSTLISMDGRLESMDGRLESMDNRLESMDQKLNLQYGLLQKIDWKVDIVKEHERRITRLEEKVFRNT